MQVEWGDADKQLHSLDNIHWKNVSKWHNQTFVAVENHSFSHNTSKLRFKAGDVVCSSNYGNQGQSAIHRFVVVDFFLGIWVFIKNQYFYWILRNGIKITVFLLNFKSIG